jgi:hypothetical protein
MFTSKPEPRNETVTLVFTKRENKMPTNLVRQTGAASTERCGLRVLATSWEQLRKL